MSDTPLTERPPAKRRWQYSVRGLLLVTAVVAGVLAVAVQMPTLSQALLVATSFVCLVAGTLWTANVMASGRQPLLGAMSWAVFGAFFMGPAVESFWLAIHPPMLNSEFPNPNQAIAAEMAICGVVCFYRAGQAMALYRRTRRAASGDGCAEPLPATRIRSGQPQTDRTGDDGRAGLTDGRF